MKKQEQKNKTVFHAVAALLAVLAVVLVLYGGGTRRLWKWMA